MAYLLHRFKANPQVALQKLHTLSYSYSDIKAGRTPQSFTEDVIRHCRTAGIVDPFNQISMIWNRLDAYLQRDIPEPTADVSLAQFLKQLEHKEHLWQNLSAKYDSRKDKPCNARYSTPRTNYSTSSRTVGATPRKTPTKARTFARGRTKPRAKARYPIPTPMLILQGFYAVGPL